MDKPERLCTDCCWYHTYSWANWIGDVFCDRPDVKRSPVNGRSVRSCKEEREPGFFFDGPCGPAGRRWESNQLTEKGTAS